MKKLIPFFILAVINMGAQNKVPGKTVFKVDKSIENEVRTKIKDSDYHADSRGTLVYETPKNVSFKANNVVVESFPGDKYDVFQSVYTQTNDGISIQGSFGLFGGYGFIVKFKDNEPVVYTYMASDDIPMYSLNKLDNPQPIIEVPCKRSKLILSESPKPDPSNMLCGYLEFESMPFFQSSPLYSEDEKLEIATIQMSMKVYFKSKFTYSAGD